LILAFTSGYLVFETFSVVGIMSRAIAYGWSLALIWVVVVLALEVFVSRRAWCTCHDVCFENQVLEITKAKHKKQLDEKGIERAYITGADCTLCGRCIDVCHVDALKFDFRLKSLV